MEIDKNDVKSAEAKKKGLFAFGSKAKDDDEGFFIGLDVRPKLVSDQMERIYYHLLPKDFIFSSSIFHLVVAIALYVREMPSEEHKEADIILT
jgi:hypothetical protein